MLVDANILLFATDATSTFHAAAVDWLEEQLSGDRRVGLPWLSLWAFLRLSTNSRVYRDPLTPDHAWAHVDRWLSVDVTWIPAPMERHAKILGQLVKGYHLSGDMIPDAQLAAIAIEHGLTVCSADTDFARFSEIRWENPISSAR
jgi:uncharacterized protein